VLSDDELHALREIERRLRWESPELVQLFNSQEPQPATNHRQRARNRGCWPQRRSRDWSN